MRVYLIRHGESELNAALSEAVDCGLTALGLRQAAALAEALKPQRLDCILSSPYRRCLQTAEVIRQATGAAAEFWPAVHEHHHAPFPPGDWPLPSRSELAAAWPAFAVPPDMPEVRWAAVPEDRSAQWNRLRAAVEWLLRRFDRQAEAGVAVVTHQAPASVWVQAFCQWPNPLNVRVHIDAGSITTLQTDPDGRRHLVRLNWLALPSP